MGGSIDCGLDRMSLAQNWRRRGMFDEVAFIFPNAPMIPITVVCLSRGKEKGDRPKCLIIFFSPCFLIELWDVHAGMV